MLSDSGGSDSDIGKRKKVKRKKRISGSGSGSGRVSDSDDEAPRHKKPAGKRRKKAMLSGSDSDSSGPERGKKNKGSGLESGGEGAPPGSPVPGEGVEEGPEGGEKALPQLSDSDDEAIRQQAKNSDEQYFVNDFDMMMAKKKEEGGKLRRRKNNVDIINDNEEHIAIIVKRMRQAAEEDRMLNEKHLPATKKIAMLNLAMSQINKHNLIEGFLDANILSALTDWLAPMPDRSLPAAKIREAVIKWLTQLPPLSQDMLKTSGIGKAIMYLYKHPKELKLNKDRCGRLISMWSRPIFNVSDDFKSLSREERLQRDLDLHQASGVTKKDELQFDESGKPLRPGDPGWCYRARVPLPSVKDYVNRPKWKSEVDLSRGSKKEMNRLEKQMRAFQEKKRMSKARRAVSISIEGRNMAL